MYFLLRFILILIQFLHTHKRPTKRIYFYLYFFIFFLFIFLIFSPWLVAKYIKSYLRSAEPNASARVQSHTHTHTYTERKWGYGGTHIEARPLANTQIFAVLWFIYVCMYVRMYVCMYVCAHAWTYSAALATKTGHDDDGDGDGDDDNDDDDASDSCGKRATILVYQTDNAGTNNKGNNNKNSRKGENNKKANNNRASLTCVYTMFVAVFSCCYYYYYFFFLRPFGPGCKPCPVSFFPQPSCILRPAACCFNFIMSVQCPVFLLRIFCLRAIFISTSAVETSAHIKNRLNQLQNVLDQYAGEGKCVYSL